MPQYEINPLHDKKMQQVSPNPMTVSDTAPLNPKVGDVWIDTSGNDLTDNVVITTIDLVVTWDHNIIEVDASGNDVTLSMPTAVGNTSCRDQVTITRVDDSAYTVTIEPFGAQTINGEANATIDCQFTSQNVYSNGTNLGVK